MLVNIIAIIHVLVIVQVSQFKFKCMIFEYRDFGLVFGLVAPSILNLMFQFV